MKACRENIIFKALTADSTPDFTTISAFIRAMHEEVKTIFINILLVCNEMELPGGTEFALDGCKMSSNAAKENSGTFSDLTRKNEKLESTIDFLMKKQIENDSADIRGKAENTVKIGRAHV